MRRGEEGKILSEAREWSNILMERLRDDELLEWDAIRMGIGHRRAKAADVRALRTDSGSRGKEVIPAAPHADVANPAARAHLATVKADLRGLLTLRGHVEDALRVEGENPRPDEWSADEWEWQRGEWSVQRDGGGNGILQALETDIEVAFEELARQAKAVRIPSHSAKSARPGRRRTAAPRSPAGALPAAGTRQPSLFGEE